MERALGFTGAAGHVSLNHNHRLDAPPVLVDGGDVVISLGRLDRQPRSIFVAMKLAVLG